MSDAVVGDLRDAGIATVIGPTDPDYQSARRVWNGDIDRHPAAIVRCQGVADVIAAVNAARESDLPLAIRGGAHSAAGHATCDDGIVIDLTPMKGIRVSPGRMTATAQTGVVWSELDRETQAFGLATPGGTVSNTGISGLTLGGGEGWLMGKFGLTVDNVLGMDLVTADGSYVRADQDENPDLFWALRGGGGNFGVVTSIDYQLHPHGPIVLGGLVAWPISDAREVLHFYRDFSSDLPDEAEAYAALLTLPEVGPVVAVLVGYQRRRGGGRAVLRAAPESRQLRGGYGGAHASRRAAEDDRRGNDRPRAVALLEVRLHRDNVGRVHRHRDLRGGGVHLA